MKHIPPRQLEIFVQAAASGSRRQAAARQYPTAAVFATAQIPTLSHRSCHADDRVVCGLAVNFGQHDIRICVDEIPRAFDRRKLGRIAKNKDRPAVAHQVCGKLGVHHRALVNDDQPGMSRGTIRVPDKPDRPVRLLLDLINQAVDRAGAVAPAALHHQSGLTCERGIDNTRASQLGEALRDRGLASASIAKDAKDRLRQPTSLRLAPL